MMEKLSDMIDPNIIDLELELKKKFESKMQNKKFKEIVDALKIDDLHLSIAEIEKNLEEKQNCLNCTSLDTCNNEIEGYCFDLSVLNNGLVEEYLMCDKLKAKQYLKNIYVYGRSIEEFDKQSSIYPDQNRVDVVKYIHNLLSDKTLGKGIYLHGSFGCGKSYIMDMLIRELARKGYRCGSAYFPELLVKIRETFKSSSDESDILNQIKNLDVLVIDDIGSEKVTAWSRDEVLGTIVQYRMDHKLFTCFTSNYNYEELLKHYCSDGEITSATRVIDRIKVLTKPFILKGKNYRNE